MKYQNREVEILSRRTTFGKEIAEICILATGQIMDVPFADVVEDSHTVSSHEIAFKAIAAKIRNEVFMQNMLAPIESNIIPLPHQILALEKVMSGQFLRFLIADEVGMGKTIETGLVLKELKLRGIVKRTLIIVPKTAMLQWKQEMKRHFNETFHIYDTDYINTLTRTFSRLNSDKTEEADNEINIWTQHNQLIVSTDSLKPLESRQGWSRQKVEEYNRYRIQSVLEADFDLLVIDECHKVGGSTQWVGRYQMAGILCNAIPNVLLETKLNQIMSELGIDKTSDVLDSTIEREDINKLYLTSLLNPARFEQESREWLDEIKQKLKNYHSTEGALPTLNSRDIKADKVEAIKHSPIPKWLEGLTKNYLRTKGIPHQLLLHGIRFKIPGFKENIYTFNIKDSINNPIPEPLSLQHEIIQTILSEAVPFTDSQAIPLVRIRNNKSVSGFWTIWHLEVKSQLEAHHVIQPVFISDDGDSFPAYAQDVWSKVIISQKEDDYFECSGIMPAPESKDIIRSITGKVENIMMSKYSEIESKMTANTDRIRNNKEKAFAFREKQMQNIGIENIRQSRLQRLYKEKELWEQNF